MSYPQVDFSNTKFESHSFWARRRDAVRQNTIPFQLEMLKKTGRYDAFKLEWHSSYTDKPTHWPVPNHLFWDSDVAKWIEGAIYALKDGKDPAVEEAIRELVDMIQHAQQPDGYLNIHFTVVEPKKRFSNFRDLHELYNCGHLVEAALAHQQHYGNDELMRPIRRYVDFLCTKLGPGPGQIHGYPGHPEIELALLRLYARTKETKYRDLAMYFIQERGNPTSVNGQHFFDAEAEARGEFPYLRPNYYPTPRSFWYQQAHKPLLEQESIEGHSVRAMYLLTSVADASIHDTAFRSKYLPVLERLWNNMVQKKMYLTGGIGAIKQWEGFSQDYFLPQSSDEGGCYAETCASIGVVMLAERMLKLDLNARYADIMELCLYNAVLTGVSLNGKGFTYVNQLASSDGNPSQREEWFECACCPPNVTRILGTLGGYLWTHSVTEESTIDVNVHLYASAELIIKVGNSIAKLVTKTRWPWSGDVEFELQGAEALSVSIRLRIPLWAESWSIKPSPSSQQTKQGYLELPPSWTRDNYKFTLSIPVQSRYISPHPLTNQPIAAVARGPLIFCAEDVDNPWMPLDHFKSTLLDTSVPLEESAISDFPNGEQCVSVVAPKAARLFRSTEGDLPVFNKDTASLSEPETIVFVPYYARANRGGKGQMRVGLRKYL